MKTRSLQKSEEFIARLQLHEALFKVAEFAKHLGDEGVENVSRKSIAENTKKLSPLQDGAYREISSGLARSGRRQQKRSER